MPKGGPGQPKSEAHCAALKAAWDRLKAAGFSRSATNRENCRKAQTGKKQTLEHRQNSAKTRTGRKRGPLTKKRREKFTFKGHKHTQESKDKIGEGNRRSAARSVAKRRANPRREEFLQNQSATMKRTASDPNWKQKVSDGNKNWWLNATEEQKAERLARSSIRPNKLEISVEEYLNQVFPGQWKYNFGDFSIAGFIPDFISTAGRKIVIEVFGNYWHKPQEERMKIAVYRKFEYQCVVIWEKDFQQNPEKLRNLIEAIYQT